MQTGTVIALLVSSIAALLFVDAANAASCREELLQFEHKLSESSLAAEEPETFANLTREAEAAAELRDEELCLQRVAELNAAVPAEHPAPPARESDTQANSDAVKRAPPAAPMLLDASPVDFEADSAEQSENPQGAESGADDRL